MRISASRINLYSVCSLKYYFRYVAKIDKPAISIHLAYGSAVHSALEHLNLSLQKSKDGLEDVFQAFQDTWDKEIEEQKLENNFYKYKLYWMGLNTLAKFYENNIDYNVIGAEQRFEVPIVFPDGFTPQGEYTLYGLMDAITKKNSDITIVDYKTSKEPYKMFKLDTSIQLAIYSYAFRQMIEQGLIDIGRKTKEDYIAYCVLLKDYDSLEGDIRIQRKKITDIHNNRMFYVLKQFIKGIESNIYIPNYESCDWCEYKQECKKFDGNIKTSN